MIGSPRHPWCFVNGCWWRGCSVIGCLYCKFSLNDSHWWGMLRILAMVQRTRVDRDEKPDEISLLKKILHQRAGWFSIFASSLTKPK